MIDTASAGKTGCKLCACLAAMGHIKLMNTYHISTHTSLPLFHSAGVMWSSPLPFPTYLPSPFSEYGPSFGFFLGCVPSFLDIYYHCSVWI